MPVVSMDACYETFNMVVEPSLGPGTKEGWRELSGGFSPHHRKFASALSCKHSSVLVLPSLSLSG